MVPDVLIVRNKPFKNSSLYYTTILQMLLVTY